MTRRIGRAQRNGAAGDTPKEIKMGTINFEDVYANAYVRESVESLVSTTVRQYPMLDNYQDDIRQELWLAINKHIPQFSPEKSNLNTFCRIVLESALKEIRRGYFSNRCISERVNTAPINEELAAYSHDDIDRFVLCKEVNAIVEDLSPIRKKICELLMDGHSMNDVARILHIPIGSLYKHHISALRILFTKAGFKK